MKKTVLFLLFALMMSMKFYAQDIPIPFDQWGNVNLSDYENYDDNQVVTVTLTVTNPDPTSGGVAPGWGIGTIKAINNPTQDPAAFSFSCQAASPEGAENVYEFTIAQFKDYAKVGGDFFVDQYGQSGITINVYNGTAISSVTVASAPRMPSSVIDFESDAVGKTYPWIKGSWVTASATVESNPSGGAGNALHVITDNWDAYPKFSVLLPNSLSTIKKITFDIYFVDNGSDQNTWKSVNYFIGAPGTSFTPTAATGGANNLIGANEAIGSWIHKELPITGDDITSFDFGLGVLCGTADYYIDNITFSTDPIYVTGVTLDQSTLNLNVGDTQQLTATVSPSTATNQNVSWSSSNPAVATVSSAGLITAVSKGTTTITVTTADGSFTATCDVTVSLAGDLISFWGSAGTGGSNTWNAATQTMTTTAGWNGGVGCWFGTPGKDLSTFNEVVVNFEPVSFDVQLYVVYNDGTSNSVTIPAGGSSAAVLLMSGKSDIKQISMQTSAAGSVHILSAFADKNAVNVTGISLDKATASMYVDDVAYLTATIAPTNATDQQVIWSSSDPSIVTVSNDGGSVTAGSSTITAAGAGTATITVTTEDGSFTATCVVTVTAPVTGVSLDQTSADLLVGKTLQLTATVKPADATDQNVTWSSSDPAVATVDANGLITAVGKGTATITVTTEDGDFTATCVVTVSPIVPLTGISLDKTTVSLGISGEIQLFVTFNPANATNQNVTWSSSDPAVATVNDNGFITAAGEGTTTITVTSEDGGFTATCVVGVSSQQGIVVPDSTQTGEAGKGSFVLSLTIPANVLFSGSFQLVLPNGVQVDLSATHLIGDLASQLDLTIVQEADGSWLFTITPQTMRSAKELVYSQVMEIGYIVDETVEKGTYEANIRDLSFTFDDGTDITESELPIQLIVTSTTGIPNLKAETPAYISGDQLYIQSTITETVQVYSVNGVLLYNFQKPEGKAIYPINLSKGAVLIAKGSSGWIKKLVMN